MHFTRSLLLIGFLTACGGKSPPPAPATEPKPMPTSDGAGSAATGTNNATQASSAADAAKAKAACDARVTKLGAALQPLVTFAPGFTPMQQDIHAPESKSGKPLDTRGYVLGVGKDGTFYTRGQKLDSKVLEQWLDAGIKEQLEAVGMAGGSFQNAKFRVYVWADKDAPAGKVAEIADIAKKTGGDRYVVQLLVAGKTPAAAMTWSAAQQAVADKVPASEPEATKYVVDQVKAAIGECSPIITPWATTDELSPPQAAAEKLAKALPEGLGKCECKIPNADVFEWGAAVWLGSTAPSLEAIALPKIKKGDKQPISKLVK